MRRLLAVTLAAFAGSFLAFALLGLPLGVRAGAGPVTTSLNGDVNGDGDIDIADVVYTLVPLFRGGPAPVACADSPELVSRRHRELRDRQGALMLGRLTTYALRSGYDAR